MKETLLVNIASAEARDIILTGGTVLTMAEVERADAVLVRGDRIVGVGSEVDCRRAAHDNPRVIDLAGAALLPGFVDAHCHPLMFGQFSAWVDCSWEAAHDIGAVVDALRERAAQQSGRPVRGHGFHHGNVAEQRMLTRHDLDLVATDREVLVFHSSGHGAIVNSFVLASAGITKETPDPQGGHFGRDDDGTPNGDVWDAAADQLTGALGVKIGNNGPNFHLGDEPDSLLENLLDAQRRMHTAGVTSVVDAQVSSREMLTYFRARDTAKLTLRVEMLVISSLLAQLEQLGIGGRLGDDRLAIAGVKIYVDGALTAATASFTESYCCDSSDHGYLYHDPQELANLVMRVERLGLQSGTHAQGDAAITILLDAHEAVRAAGGRCDARHRIEHCGGATREQVARIADLGVWPIPQPQYVRRYGQELARVLGSERAARIMPLGEFRDAGVTLVISSDAPVCPPWPLEAVQAAATRVTISGDLLDGGGDTISVADALKAHTLGAAASIHREKSVGSIEPGKFADFVILSKDPCAIPMSDLTSIEVLETWVGGVVVFSADGRTGAEVS
ncbi:MAG: amidohydrolase [Terrimesophilobacter sp.]